MIEGERNVYIVHSNISIIYYSYMYINNIEEICQLNIQIFMVLWDQRFIQHIIQILISANYPNKILIY